MTAESRVGFLMSGFTGEDVEHTHTHTYTPFTFRGQIAAPKSGKTVAPPASTLLI